MMLACCHKTVIRTTGMTARTKRNTDPLHQIRNRAAGIVIELHRDLIALPDVNWNPFTGSTRD